ncbi:hypothetical protein D3C79_704860 [compost metagenome]
MRACHAVALPAMIDRSHPLATGVALTRFGLHHCVVRPAALPELVGHIHEFLRALVAVGMLDHLFQAEVASSTGKVGRDDVPGDPAIGHVIERAEAPGMREGMLVGRGNGSAECQIPGDRS